MTWRFALIASALVGVAGLWLLKPWERPASPSLRGNESVPPGTPHSAPERQSSTEVPKTDVIAKPHPADTGVVTIEDFERALLAASPETQDRVLAQLLPRLVKHFPEAAARYA